MSDQIRITLDGWYCVAKDYPDLSRTVLDSKIFKKSARVFNLNTLHITDIDRIQGSFFNPCYVKGVVCTSGSLIPFFILRQKAKELQELIDSVQDNTSITL
jgi:hypothetical protein